MAIIILSCLLFCSLLFSFLVIRKRNAEIIQLKKESGPTKALPYLPSNNPNSTFHPKEFLQSIRKRNNRLRSIHERLESLEKGFKNSAGENLEIIKRFLMKEMSSKEDWDRFLRSFERSFLNFFRGIKERYPHLSSNDLRLIALIKMDLSTQEIGDLLDISSEGVNKARYRLRKKMEVGQGFKLDEFVRDFYPSLP